MRLEKYRFEIELLDDGKLPAYKGSLFRGVLGNSLKKSVCINRTEKCIECPVIFDCLYTKIFEPNDLMDNIKGKQHAKSRGFLFSEIIDDRKIYKTGDRIYFDLLLIGQFTAYFSLFLLAFNEIEKIGLGKERLKYKVTRVWKIDLMYQEKVLVFENNQLQNNLIAKYEDVVQRLINESPNKVQEYLFSFKTWTRLQYQGHLTKNIDFELLLRAVLRRLEILISFNSEYDLPENFYNNEIKDQLIRLSKEVVLVKDTLRWEDWKRFSRREKQVIMLGGFQGDIRFKGDQLERFYPYLKIGEWMHIGKNTTFGLGQYDLMIR